MPVNQPLMDDLKRQYGAKRGESVYYAMEASGRGPFAAGKELHQLHLDFAEKHHLQPVTSRPAKKTRPRGRPRQHKAPPTMHKARGTGPPKR